MPFAIVADLPLGTYRGAGQDGRPERVPSVARLHSALLCAAGFGPRAVAPGMTRLDVATQDETALRWLEDNPPDSVAHPRAGGQRRDAVAYRDDGTLKKSTTGELTIKKLPKAPDAGTAVGGQFAWIWHQEPPEPVRAAIEQLCPDVAYLGTTESPVRLTATSGADIGATHDLDPRCQLLRGQRRRRRPAGCLAGSRNSRLRTGRRAEDRRRLRGTRPGTDEKSLSQTPVRRAVESARYRPRQRPSAKVPWSRVIVVPLSGPIDEWCRVRWAVAAHRALVKFIGYGAPPLITGAYPAGVPRPANRLALQLLSPDMPGMPAAGRAPASLAILVPPDASSADLAALDHALEGFTSLRGPGGKRVRIDQAGVQAMDASRFWLPPAPDHLRLWRTEPAAVPDTRGAGRRAGPSRTPPCCRWGSPGRTSCPRSPAGARAVTAR